jgi:hypothetical protein
MHPQTSFGLKSPTLDVQDTMESDKPTKKKRKERTALHKDDIGEQSSMRAPPKRYKGKAGSRAPKFNLAALSPYGFLIDSPPSHYAPIYVQLCDWIGSHQKNAFSFNYVNTTADNELAIVFYRGCCQW